MKNVIHLINNLYNNMQRAERAVAEYVLQNPDEVILMSMKALANKVEVSDNSVLRFCRTCGFSGYLDFKTALLPQIITQKRSIYQQVQILPVRGCRTGRRCVAAENRRCGPPSAVKACH